MNTGTKVWVEGGRAKRGCFFKGTVAAAHTERGILVTFEHGGGAWFAEQELRSARAKHDAQVKAAA